MKLEDAVRTYSAGKEDPDRVLPDGGGLMIVMYLLFAVLGASGLALVWLKALSEGFFWPSLILFLVFGCCCLRIYWRCRN